MKYKMLEMCALLFLCILTTIFKSSLNQLRDTKLGIFGQEAPSPNKSVTSLFHGC